MRHTFLVLTPVLALSACATGPSLQSRMAAYIGDNTQTLVQGLGVPDKQITANGVQYLAYVQHSYTIEPGGYYGGPFGPFGGAYYGGGFYPPAYGAAFPSDVQVYYCEVTFLLKNDKVLTFTLRGNYCV